MGVGLNLARPISGFFSAAEKKIAVRHSYILTYIVETQLDIISCVHRPLVLAKEIF
jgi:hypothetical protein